MLSLVKKLGDPSWPDIILKQTNLMMLDMPVAPSLFFLPSVLPLISLCNYCSTVRQQTWDSPFLV